MGLAMSSWQGGRLIKMVQGPLRRLAAGDFLGSWPWKVLWQ